MLSIEQLREKSEKMQTFLERKSGQEPNDIIERLEHLNIMVAQSGQCLADAKYYQDQIINSTITKALTEAYHDKLSATLINQFVKTSAKDYNYLVNVFDRINATATHQIDSYRTILSYRKTEMSL